MSQEYWTTSDLEERYEVSRNTIERWRKEGMPHKKIGYGVFFETKKTDKWVKENKDV